MGVITSLKITAAGTGHAVGDVITLVNASGPTVTVTDVDSGTGDMSAAVVMFGRTL